MATTTAPVIDNFKKNILGTAQFDLKIGGMRSPQAFNVVPMGKGGSTDVIIIQSGACQRPIQEGPILPIWLSTGPMVK